MNRARRIRSSPLRFAVVAGLCGLMTALAASHVSAELAQAEFVVRSWNRQDGLPPTPISSIQRTANGYLWLATQWGLVRFDGAQFKLLDAQNHPELRTNYVSSLLADADGGLWVGTSAGISYFPEGRVGGQPVLDVGESLPAYAFASGTGGAVWALAGSNEVVRLAGMAVDVRLKNPGTQPIRFIVSDDKGAMTAASRSELYAPKDDRLVKLPEKASSGVPFDVIAVSHSGGFWFASGTEVRRVDESGSLLEMPVQRRSDDAPQSPIMAIMEDRAGRLWVGTRGGAVHCFESGGGWRHVTARRSRSLGSISTFHEDNEGLIWVGTAGGILHQIKPRILATWSLPSAAQESATQTVCVRRDGTVWVGTDGAGAYRSRDGTFQRFGAQQGLTNATVMAIFEDRQANLWFGTLGGLYRLENGRLQPELASLLSGQPVPVVFQDRAEDLWFGTTGAVVRKRGEELRRYEFGEGFEEVEVRAIAEDPEGEIWIGTRGAGLFRLRDGAMEKVEAFPRPTVNAIHCDSDGVLWVGTRARGLYRIDGEDVHTWMVGDGLPSNMLFAILEDDAGTLWLSSNEGVFGLSKEALMAYSRGKTPPLLAIQLAVPDAENWSAGSGQPSAAMGLEGRLWFPMSHGVLAFDPAMLLRPRPELPVLVETVLADGVEQPLSRTGPLKVLSGVRRLEFRYTIADLDAPGKLRFRYKLEGVDEDWVDRGGQRTAYYDRLAPGHYRFRVISAGSGNLWTEMVTPLAVRIVPRIWETGWFRTLSALLIIGLVGGTAHFIGRAKMRRKLERLEMRHAMEKERHRIAQDLHDDLGSGITEIMLLTELAKQTGHTPENIDSQLGGITEKSRQLATAMDEIVWTVNPRNDSLPHLASYLCDYAQEFFRPVQAHCRIDLTEGLPPVAVTAQQRHNLFMAVKEALNNAAKHACASEVWLRIRWAQGCVTVIVEDNGAGFGPAAGCGNNSGNGLRNMKARLAAIHGATELSSRPGQGTRISFSLPLTVAKPANASWREAEKAEADGGN